MGPNATALVSYRGLVSLPGTPGHRQRASWGHRQMEDICKPRRRSSGELWYFVTVTQADHYKCLSGDEDKAQRPVRTTS